MKPPVDYSTEAEVRALAIGLREKHDALTWSASVDDLVKAQGLEQGRFRGTRGLIDTVRDAIDWAAKKVLALVSVKEKVILISDDLHDAKHPFAKAHEVGHTAIPWHKAILFACDEHDLSPQARAQLEWEASTFGAELLIPAPLLASVYGKYPTSMDTVLLLREWSGASIETSAITYASKHPGTCALLVLDDDPESGGLILKRKTLSAGAVTSPLSQIEKVQKFPPSHALCRARSRDGTTSFQVHLRGDGTTYKASGLYNGYRVMVLLFEGE